MQGLVFYTSFSNTDQLLLRPPNGGSGFCPLMSKDLESLPYRLLAGNQN